MRCTGRKCFILPMGWWHSLYGRNYLRVWVKNTSEGSTTQPPRCKIHHHVVQKCVRAGKLNHLINFTEKNGGFPHLYRRTATTSLSFGLRNSGHSSPRTPAPAVHRAGDSWWPCSGEADRWPWSNLRPSQSGGSFPVQQRIGRSISGWCSLHKL